MRAVIPTNTLPPTFKRAVSAHASAKHTAQFLNFGINVRRIGPTSTCEHKLTKKVQLILLQLLDPSVEYRTALKDEEAGGSMDNATNCNYCKTMLNAMFQSDKLEKITIYLSRENAREAT